jgi:nicotinamide mononucleotide transporter PnuC
MNLHKLPHLTKFERALWLSSLVVVLACFFLSGMKGLLSTIASAIGVTALIFIAKGAWQGQALCIVFASLYGIVSFQSRYYGEMLTYLCMSLPMAIFSLIAWLRNPFEGKNEVKVEQLTKKKLACLALCATLVSIAFFFILRALDTAELAVSTVSVTTSFIAASLVFLRSPYYALGYAANDIVLITLWVIAALASPAAWPMVACFVMFFFNDLHGFYNWHRMQKRQRETAR